MATKKATPQPRTVASLRGLASSGEVKRRDGYRTDPRRLEIDPGFNLRVADDPELRAHIDSIKESIRDFITRDNPDNRVWTAGLQEVIPELVIRVTEDGRILIVDGHCRTTAIRELIAEGFDITEVEIKATKEDETGRTLIMLRSAQSKDLAPIEKAMGYLRLADGPEKMSFPEIARALGNSVTPQRVEQLVLLARAPVDVRILVEEHKVTADSAIEVLRKHREQPEEAERILMGLVAQKGSRPVGKGQTRVAIPKKVQEGIYSALVAETKTLTRQIEELESNGNDDWEAEMVQVTLPAGVVKQLLDQQAKAKASESAEAA